MKIINDFFSLPHDKKRVIIYSLIFFALSVGVGTLFHFMFDILDEAMWAAPFFPVNESIWEHLKLSYFPVVLLMPVEYFLYGKRTDKFVSSRTVGIVAAMITVVTLYYTINGAFGKTPDFVNIIIYIIATFLCYALSAGIMLSAGEDSGKETKVAAIITLAAIFVFFLAFTFYPPKLPLFLDPLGDGYGFYRFMK